MSFRVYNQLDSIQQYFTPSSFRAIQFESFLSSPPNKIIEGITTLSSDEWIQASIDALVVSVTGITGYINLGDDTVESALNYINFFQINSTNESRLLKFVVVSPLGDSSINLGLTAQTSDHINVCVNNTEPSSSSILFTGSDVIKHVIVSATNLEKGSEQVRFNILN
jgi:hypothetical protein